MTNIQHKRSPIRVGSLPQLKKKSLNQGQRKQQLVKITMENHVETTLIVDDAKKTQRTRTYAECGLVKERSKAQLIASQKYL